MTFTTRLSLIFNRYTCSLQNKLVYIQNQITALLCLLFIGFLMGNLFGSFLNLIRQFLVWDGLIAVILVVIMEIFSYATYHAKDRCFGVFLIHPKSLNCLLKLNKSRRRSGLEFWRKFNLFKIGLMIGFFVDAFKVGS